MVDITIDPIIVRWGPIVIGWHGIWFALGAFVAYRTFLSQGRRRGFAPDDLRGYVLAVAVCGYGGARLAHVLTRWAQEGLQPGHPGGTTVYGALLGIAVAAVLYARSRGLSLRPLADAGTAALLLGELIGKVGCVLTGDIAGAPTGGHRGLVYWHPNAAISPYLRGAPTYPIPLMVQLWIAGMLLLLFALRERPLLPGARFLLSVIVYSAGQLLIGAYRLQDPLMWGLKPTQGASLLAMLVAAAFLALLIVRGQQSAV